MNKVYEDFLIDNNKAIYEITPENQTREVGGFAAIEKETILTKKTIITYNQSSIINDVEIIPLWKWIFNTK